MSYLKQFGLGATSLGLAVSLSCGTKTKEDESTTNADGSTKLTEMKTVDQLGVSAALGKLSLPAAYSPKKASLALTMLAAKKSQDACLMGDGIKSSTEGISNIGSFFCHIEAEKDKIQFGTKYNITAKGVAFAQVWIDNTQAADGVISLFMCEKNALKQAIKITGVKLDANNKPTGIKGNVSNKGSQGTQSWASSSTFDKNFTGAYLEVSAKDKYDDSGTKGGSFARAVILKLFDAKTEVSKVSMASAGTWGGQTFKQRGTGKGANDFGQALFVNSGTYGGSAFDWTHRSYFTLSTGLVAKVGDSADYAVGGSLYVTTTELPEYLATSFTPDAPSGWDCSGTTVTVDLDPDSAAHKACDGDHSEGASCWGDDFESGQNQ